MDSLIVVGIPTNASADRWQFTLPHTIPLLPPQILSLLSRYIQTLRVGPCSYPSISFLILAYCIVLSFVPCLTHTSPSMTWLVIRSSCLSLSSPASHTLSSILRLISAQAALPVVDTNLNISCYTAMYIRNESRWWKKNMPQHLNLGPNLSLDSYSLLTLLFFFVASSSHSSFCLYSSWCPFQSAFALRSDKAFPYPAVPVVGSR